MTAKQNSKFWRVAIGGIIHETHTFAEGLTTLADFKSRPLHFGDDILSEMSGTRSAIGGMIEGANTRGWTLMPTAYGTAMPGGTVADSAYSAILQELLDRLAAAGPVDGILLALHGAMVTETQLDPESHILAEVRKVVGPNTPIVVELDMHGNISPRTVELATVLVAFDTNPHVDPHAKGLESAAILEQLLASEVMPTAAYRQPHLMFSPQATGTADLPLRAVHERATAMKQEDDVLSICVMAGFAYADTPFTGASIIVTTHNKRDLAERYAQELVDLMMKYHQTALPEFLPPSEAVSRALNMAGGPIILVDSADNIGGGTPGDGTDALRAMLDHNVQEGAIVLADPEAVAACWEAGPGADISLAVGGKFDRWHGEAITVSGTVKAVSNGEFECELPDNHFASFFGNTIQMGRTIWLRVDGINIILTEQKTPPFDLAQLRGVGVVPETQKLIVVKSAVAYRAAYMPIAAGVVEMDTAGLCTANLARFPYKHLRRPIFPLDAMDGSDG